METSTPLADGRTSASKSFKCKSSLEAGDSAAPYAGEEKCATAPLQDELADFIHPSLKDGYRLQFFVPGMNCAGCMRKIERHFENDDRFRSVRVNLSQKQVTFEWQDKTILGSHAARDLSALGFDVRPLASPDEANREGANELRHLIWCLAVAGFGAANIMLLSVSVWSGAEGATRDLFHWLSALIALPVIAYAGQPFFHSALTALKSRRLNMDVPISLAVILAAGLSLYETANHGEHAFFDAAVSLLFFLLIGRVLDKMMRERAFSGVRQLLALKAQTAMLITDEGRRQAISVKRLQPGMVIAIAPGETVPVDGELVSGESDLDWSIVNGEAMPRTAHTGDKLFGGLVNLTGPLTLKVTAVGEDTLLSEIIRLMENAEATAPTFQRVADKAAAIYAPVVHIAALATFIGWMLAGQSAEHSLYIAISVLIITCPCALGLAVPVVQVVANAIAYRQGVLMKDGGALERLGQVDAVYFDKTGTLTTGVPEPRGQFFAAEALLPMASCLAMGSLHPLSKALCQLGGAADQCGKMAELTRVREVPGEGLEGYVGEKRYRIGKRDWCEIPAAIQADVSSSENGSQLMLWVSLSKPGADLIYGLFTFQDDVRPGAAYLTAALKAAHLPLTLLSGDRVEATACMAQSLGIEAYHGEMKPQDKAEMIKAAGQRGEKVLMIGDGINDGPSLKAAYVSASLQSASDVAQVTAGFVIMGRALTPLAGLFKLAHKTKWLVRENFALAAIYNLIAVPLAVMGGVTPIVAAIAMSASSILVTLNALRLYHLARPSSWEMPKSAASGDSSTGLMAEANRIDAFKTEGAVT